MEAFYLLYYVNGKRDYMILQANSIEHAVKKSDLLPTLIYHVSTLKEWEDFNRKRFS
jgi:hypothetical protein